MTKHCHWSGSDHLRIWQTECALDCLKVHFEDHRRRRRTEDELLEYVFPFVMAIYE